MQRQTFCARLRERLTIATKRLKRIKMSSLTEELTKEFVSKYWKEQPEIPKHERLKLAFSESILDGFWARGARLPTEADLVANTPCSLGTIQRALRELSLEGLIKRRRGSGTVVAYLGGKLSDPWHIRYLDKNSKTDKYLTLKTRFISRKIVHQRGPWSDVLRQDDEPAIKIDRIFTVDDRIDIYSEFYALKSRFPEFLELPESKLNGLNFKKLVAARYRAPVNKVRQHLRFETPRQRVQDCGICQSNGLVAVLNVIAYPLSGEAIYYQDFFLPSVEAELDLGFAMQT